MSKLDGKVALVTGASRGLGAAMVIGFAAEGATVVLAACTRADLDRVATAQAANRSLRSVDRYGLNAAGPV
ncbi:SDR family NAD(P)-dependent oxidoreductase [Nitrococcus mobilis]|uniref:Dehydrogenase n=1 Tax=Nitrococcus mobilis Nb-231 TaxID=314278 RepID=A4BLB3_9GAMM|nr:SDR family NAD(P)-dependent oxidoreductase [Nitrococcus mobilis]EAR23101.1 dehydrogenase [Nitrococcus mobilis Nb-231]